VIREGYAEGRLTYDEHSERLDRVFRAKTLGELMPLVADLPTVGDAARPAGPAPPGAGMPVGGTAQDAVTVAVFAGAERGGSWVVPAQTFALALFGGVDLDLTHAALAEREVTINAFAMFGGVDVIVPEGVEVRVSVIPLFGGTSRPHDKAPAPPGAPVVTVRGLVMFGGIDVRRPKRPKRDRKPDQLPPGTT